MTTRIYLPFDLDPDPALSPAFDAAWEKVGSYRYQCGPIKKGTVPGEITNYETSATNPYDVAVVQFISGPLRAQTINGTVKGQILAREANAAANQGVALVIRVLTSTGVVRGTLLSHFPANIGTEFSTTVPTNAYFPPANTALTEVVAQDGDRLCIELGFRAYNAVTTSYAGYLTVGDGADTDLPENETEVAYLNPWLQFSGDLSWQITDAYVATGGWMICGAGDSGEGDDLVAEYAADGALEFQGGCDYEFVTPAEGEYAASGGYKVCGESTYNLPPVNQFQAAGQIELSGVSKMASTRPYVSPGTSLTTAFAAAGSFALGSTCILDSLTALLAEYAAAGGYSLEGAPAYTGTTPATLQLDAYAAAGAYSLSAPCQNPRGPVSAYAADTEMGPVYRLFSNPTAGFIFPPVTDMVAEGGYVLENPEVPDEGVFETLVLTGGRGEVSFYGNFNFNSYARFGGKYYAASQDGIFLLEGDDDDGAEIRTGARIGPTNFGTDREKRMRLVRCGGECEGAQVRVLSETGQEEVKDVIGGRAACSRKVQGREITVDIAGFKSLTHLEIIPLVLAKR